jgi:ABC-type transporter Mla subunit MlaD
VTSARVLFLPLIAALVLAAAGCGKSSKPETASEWASGLCSSITTWKDSVTSAVSPLKSGNITKDSINTAYDDFKSATDTFVKSVKDLGKPATQAGDQAKSDIDQLTTEIDNSVQTIKSDVNNISDVTSALAAVPSVTGTLASIRTDVATTYSNLRQLDAGGELSTAFTNAESCKTLTASVSSG